MATVAFHVAAVCVSRVEIPRGCVADSLSTCTHDGRYTTLEELLLGSDGKMGRTASLSRDDLQALSAYLETLPDTPPASFPDTAPGAPPASALASASAERTPEAVAFPEGWVRPAAPAMAMATPSRPGKRSLQRLFESSGAPRIPLHPVTIPLADLPRIEVEPKPDLWPPITTRPHLEEAKEILAFRGGVSVRDRPLGFIQVDFDSAPIYAFAGGGVWESCRGDAQGYSGIEWQSLSAQPDGTAKFERGFAWFDRATCKSYAIEHNEVRAHDIGGGIAFAFRTACPKCKDGAGMLHIIVPRVNWDSGSVGDGVVMHSRTDGFSHAELPLRPGAAGAVVLRFTPDGITEWKKSGVKTAHDKHSMLGVHVSQGAEVAEPAAIVYVADLPAP